MDRGAREKEAVEKIKSRIARPRRRRTSAVTDQSSGDVSSSDLGALVESSGMTSSPSTEASTIAAITPVTSHPFSLDLHDLGDLADFEHFQDHHARFYPPVLEATSHLLEGYLPDFDIGEVNKQANLTPVSEDQALQLVEVPRSGFWSTSESSSFFDTESILLGRYLGQLVSAQFPFVQASTSNRNHHPFWLQTLLFSSEPARTATCQLMRTYLGVSDDEMHPQSTVQDTEPEDSPHVILSMLDSKFRQRRIVETCTGKLQEIFIKV
jgi:hypothetical protein